MSESRNTTLYKAIAGLLVIGGLLMWFVPRDSMSVVFLLVIWLAIAAVVVGLWVADKTQL